MTDMLFSPAPPLALIEGIGGPELILVVLLVLVLFGGKSLPEFARGLGRAMREFKKATSGVEDELRKAMDDTPVPARRVLPAPRTVAKAAVPASTPPGAPPAVASAVPPAPQPAAAAPAATPARPPTDELSGVVDP